MSLKFYSQRGDGVSDPLGAGGQYTYDAYVTPSLAPPEAQPQVIQQVAAPKPVEPFKLPEIEAQVTHGGLDLTSKLYETKGEIELLANDMAARGIDVFRPDPRDPNAIRAAQFFRQKKSEFENLANQLKIGLETQKNYQAGVLSGNYEYVPYDTSKPFTPEQAMEGSQRVAVLPEVENYNKVLATFGANPDIDSLSTAWDAYSKAVNAVKARATAYGDERYSQEYLQQQLAMIPMPPTQETVETGSIRNITGQDVTKQNWSESGTRQQLVPKSDYERKSAAQGKSYAALYDTWAAHYGGRGADYMPINQITDPTLKDTIIQQLGGKTGALLYSPELNNIPYGDNMVVKGSINDPENKKTYLILSDMNDMITVKGKDGTTQKFPRTVIEDWGSYEDRKTGDPFVSFGNTYDRKLHGDVIAQLEKDDRVYTSPISNKIQGRTAEEILSEQYKKDIDARVEERGKESAAELNTYFKTELLPNLYKSDPGVQSPENTINRNLVIKAKKSALSGRPTNATVVGDYYYIPIPKGSYATNSPDWTWSNTIDIYDANGNRLVYSMYSDPDNKDVEIVSELPDGTNPFQTGGGGTKKSELDQANDFFKGK